MVIPGDARGVCHGWDNCGCPSDANESLDSFYQEFLAKKLTDKYSFLNKQMDKVVHNANTEIKSLQARVLGWSPITWHF